MQSSFFRSEVLSNRGKAIFEHHSLLPKFYLGRMATTMNRLRITDLLGDSTTESVNLLNTRSTA